MLRNMETYTCNANNHLDTDALLPPRKRLLAGFKRQNSDINSPSSSKNDICLNNPFIAHLSNPNLSIEDIVEASTIAAIEATKFAKAAKTKAEEKAAKAAKAVTVAKHALDRVATLPDEASKKETCVKRNKMKKQVTVEELYNSRKKSEINCGKDEELAHNLHRAMNSSPRISKNTDTKNRHKKLKSSAFRGRINSRNEITNVEGDQTSIATSNGNGVVGNVDTEGPIKKIDMVMADLITSTPEKSDQQKLDNEERIRSVRNERMKLGNSEVLDSFGKKKGRVKPKKLPLSICNFRDQSGSKEELKSQGTNGALLSSGNNLVPVERMPMRKCQSFKVTAVGVEQNKVMQL